MGVMRWMEGIKSKICFVIAQHGGLIATALLGHRCYFNCVDFLGERSEGYYLPPKICSYTRKRVVLCVDTSTY